MLKIQELIEAGGGHPGIKYEIVEELPAEGEDGVIYLVPDGKGTYDEYLWIETKFEKIGSTDIDLTDYAKKEWVENKGYSTFSGSYDDLTDKPTLFSGSYNDLTNKPELFSGNYADLTNKPTIPTDTNQLTNGAGYVTASYHDSTKQDALSSGTNIKTVNNQSLLGAGNINISAEPAEAAELEVRRLFRTEYTITTSVTNGSYSGDSSIWTKETADVTVTADSGYKLPETITVSGATYTYNSGDIVLSAVTGNVSISVICEEDQPVPPTPGDLSKGDIIHFDALGNGTQKRFRVIDVDSGNTVKLLGLDDLGNSVYNASSRTVQFDNGSSYQNYESSDLDTYLNTTYYNSLSSAVKAAIVDETLVQSCYSRATGQSSSAAFNIKRLDNDTVYAYTRTTQRTVGSRHIHAIELDEIKSYFNASVGDLIQGTAINELFYEQTTAISKYVWCASASADYSNYAFFVTGISGFLSRNYYITSYVVRPAFKINLSTIEYTKE